MGQSWKMQSDVWV